LKPFDVVSHSFLINSTYVLLSYPITLKICQHKTLIKARTLQDED